MKTALPTAIETIKQAKAFLKALYLNGESFHPEDDANDIVWDECEAPTQQEADHLNKLISDIYNLNGNNGNHAAPLFDPCGYLLSLHNKRSFTNAEFQHNVENGKYTQDEYIYTLENVNDGRQKYLELTVIATDETGIVEKYQYTNRKEANKDIDRANTAGHTEFIEA